MLITCRICILISISRENRMGSRCDRVQSLSWRPSDAGRGGCAPPTRAIRSEIISAMVTGGCGCVVQDRGGTGPLPELERGCQHSVGGEPTHRRTWIADQLETMMSIGVLSRRLTAPSLCRTAQSQVRRPLDVVADLPGVRWSLLLSVSHDFPLSARWIDSPSAAHVRQSAFPVQGANTVPTPSPPEGARARVPRRYPSGRR